MAQSFVVPFSGAQIIAAQQYEASPIK